MFVNGPVMCGELKPDRSRIVFDAFLRNPGFKSGRFSGFCENGGLQVGRKPYFWDGELFGAEGYLVLFGAEGYLVLFARKAISYFLRGRLSRTFWCGRLSRIFSVKKCLIHYLECQKMSNALCSVRNIVILYPERCCPRKGDVLSNASNRNRIDFEFKIVAWQLRALYSVKKCLIHSI